jgi:hypothetical protein
VVRPLLILDVDLRAGVGGELGVRVGDGLGPAGLRVDHEPDGQGLALAVQRVGRAWGACGLVVAAATTRSGADQCRRERRGNCDPSLHAILLDESLHKVDKCVRGGFWGAAPIFGAMVELSFMKES